MVSIIDYGGGNIFSVCNALTKLLYNIHIADTVKAIHPDTKAIVMPGVSDGSFMMKELHTRGFIPFLTEWMQDNKPLLGICVGAQVLLSLYYRRQ